MSISGGAPARVDTTPFSVMIRMQQFPASATNRRNGSGLAELAEGDAEEEAAAAAAAVAEAFLKSAPLLHTDIGERKRAAIALPLMYPAVPF